MTRSPIELFWTAKNQSDQVWRSLDEEKGGSSMRRNVGHLEPSLVSNSNRPQLCSQRFHFHPIPTVLCPRQNWFLLLVLHLLNYFCPVSLSRPSWSRCSRQPPLKFTLLCNRQKAQQIFPPKELFLHNGAEIKKHSTNFFHARS